MNENQILIKVSTDDRDFTFTLNKNIDVFELMEIYRNITLGLGYFESSWRDVITELAEGYKEDF